jgi:ABC-type branched-subunit amino acid transport system ATPase component
VRTLRDQGKTFLVIEHDMELLQAVSERVIVMDAGVIVAEGTFSEISRNEMVIDAYLGRPDA